MFKKKETPAVPEDRKQNLLAKVKPIIAGQLNIDESKINLSSRIKEDLQADSLDATELVMALEEAFGIEIMDSDAEKMITVEDVVVYLALRIKE
jgi:acyl carrier protein